MLDEGAGVFVDLADGLAGGKRADLAELVAQFLAFLDASSCCPQIFLADALFHAVEALLDDVEHLVDLIRA